MLNTKGDLGGWKNSLALICASSSGFSCLTAFSAASETAGDLDGVGIFFRVVLFFFCSDLALTWQSLRFFLGAMYSHSLGAPIDSKHDSTPSLLSASRELLDLLLFTFIRLFLSVLILVLDCVGVAALTSLVSLVSIVRATGGPMAQTSVVSATSAAALAELYKFLRSYSRSAGRTAPAGSLVGVAGKLEAALVGVATEAGDLPPSENWKEGVEAEFELDVGVSVD